MDTHLQVAVLGLGRMGAAIAGRLSATGHTVTGWTRSGRRPAGLACVESAAAAATGADVVLLALYDGAACLETLAAIRGSLDERPVVVNTSTVGIEEAAALAEALGDAYVHAPVLGSTPAVAAGSLEVLAAGRRLGAVRPVLDPLGTVVEVCDARTSAALKLVANSSLAGAMLALRESLLQADALGLPRAQVLDVLAAGQLGALVARKRAHLDGIVTDAEFTLAALAKDADLLTAASGAPFPAAAALEELPADSDIAVAALAPGVPEEVLVPLHAYIAGHATGDAAHFREAFLPSAHVEGIREGAFTSWTLDDYCALFTGKPAPDEPQRRRRIDSVDVSGTVATARMTLWHGADTFTDVFLLVRTEGRWQIANKAYHRRPA